MGMFDHVRCEFPLPGRPVPVPAFQTKDLECELDTYTITSGGILVREKFRGDDEEYNRPPMEATVVPYTGTIRFYGDDANRNWYVYEASFHYGHLQVMRWVEFNEARHTPAR